MKKTNMLALLLVVALLAAMLGACGSTGSQQDTSEASASSAETVEEAASSAETAEPAAEPEAETEAGSEAETEETAEALDPAVGYELPLFDPDEGVSFSMWVSFSDIGGDFMPDGYESNLAYLQSVEMTGVTIDMTQVSTDTNTEKFNIMIASGEYPDIITNVTQLWSDSYDTAIEEGIFIDLTDMIENYMPYYKSFYDQLSDSVKRDLHTDSGYIPKLISINANPDGATEGAFVRTDLLDKLGLDMPTTYDDLYEVLAAFKNSGMNEALMLPSGITHTSNALCSGYGINGGFATEPMISEPFFVQDGEVKYGIVEEGYKEYMQMLVDFYQAGYISGDFMTKNSNPMGSDYAATAGSDDVGIFMGETGMIPTYYGVAESDSYEIYPLTTITKTEGEITHFGTYKSEISGRLATIAITTNISGREEQLGKYLDFFFTEEGAKLSAMGIEGNEDGSYIIDEDGKLQYSDYWYEIDIADTSKSTLFIYSVMPMLKPETPSTYTMDVQEICADVWDSNTDADYRMPDYLSMTVDESDKYNTYYSDVQTTVQENLLKFVTGERSMDEWDSFVDTLWDIGLQTCIDQKQAAYDRYLNRSV